MKSLVLVLVCMSSWAWAEPYGAEPASYVSLLQSASYDEAPLEMSYPLVSQQTALRGGRLDFEQVYDISMDRFVRELEQGYARRASVGRLRSNFLRNSTGELVVQGVSQTGDGWRYTLGVKDAGVRFVVDVSERAGRTVVVVHNTVIAELYSGVMPARGGYRPKNAKRVHFRWN